LTKSFWLEGDTVTEAGYSKAKFFSYTTHEVTRLEDLYALLERFAAGQDTCLIRGMPVEDLPQPVRRVGENFPMPVDGTRWVCLDIDGISLPPYLSPSSLEAVEYAIQQLPAEFHRVSYIAQFSASAGLLQTDGTPYKQGLRVHLYFVLERDTTNAELKNWLHEYPVDLAVFSAVQPHYVCDPILGEGVQCAVERRLNLVRKDEETISVPSQVLPYGGDRCLGPSNTNWVDPADGPPTLDDLLTCEFVDWYLSRPHPEGERYEQSRAFAHNLRRVATEDWETLLEQLIPGDFPYTDAIVASAEHSRPIGCGHIYLHAYRCPQYDPFSGACRINRSARTPYGLALWMKQGLNKKVTHHG
jgi:hypothetical protein